MIKGHHGKHGPPIALRRPKCDRIRSVSPSGLPNFRSLPIQNRRHGLRVGTGIGTPVAPCLRRSHPTPIVPAMSQQRPWRAVDPDLFRFTTTELRDLHIGLMSAFDQAAIVAPALNLDQVRATLRTVGWEEWVDDASLQRALIRAGRVGPARRHPGPRGGLQHPGGVRAEKPPVVAHAPGRGGDQRPPPRPRQSQTRGRTTAGGPRRHRRRSG